MLPLISVIIPTYSRPKYLSRAIYSILNQTYSNIEIIVVDDNGENTENQKATENVMFCFSDNDKIQYVKHKKNMNASAARNTGLAFARGEYIAFLDDDDEFLPMKLEKQYNILCNKDSNIYGGCYCGCQYKKNGIIKQTRNLRDGNLIEDLLLMKNPIYGGSSLLLRKTVCDKLCGFDTSFIRHQDWEFLVRFFRHYKLALVDEVLVNLYYDARIYICDPNSLVLIKTHFLLNFKEDIEVLPSRSKIYMRHYWAIALSYLRFRLINQGISFFIKANKYHFIGINRAIYTILYGIYFYYIQKSEKSY